MADSDIEVASLHTDENWKVVSDPKERKRLQNRIAQRTYRDKVKRRLQALEDQETQTAAHPSPTKRKPRHGSHGHGRHQSSLETSFPKDGTHQEPSPSASSGVVVEAPQDPFDATTDLTIAALPDLSGDLEFNEFSLGDAVKQPDWDFLSRNLESDVLVCQQPTNNRKSTSLQRSEVDQILEAPSHHSNSSDSHHGKTPLHLAAEHGQLDCVQLLLDRTMHVSSQDSFGRTALHLAVQSGHYAIVALLLQPVRQQKLGRRGKEASENDRRRDKEDVDIINIQDCEGHTPLHVAATSGQSQMVQKLLKLGEGKLNLEAKDIRGRTALHLAGMMGHRSVVELLLDNDADVNAKVG